MSWLINALHSDTNLQSVQNWASIAQVCFPIKLSNLVILQLIRYHSGHPLQIRLDPWVAWLQPTTKHTSILFHRVMLLHTLIVLLSNSVVVLLPFVLSLFVLTCFLSLSLNSLFVLWDHRNMSMPSFPRVSSAQCFHFTASSMLL